MNIQKALFLVIIIVIAVAAGCAKKVEDNSQPEQEANQPDQETSQAEQQATQAAQDWLALIDRQQNAESWEQAVDYLKNAVSQEQWAQSIKAVRDPLGALVSREVMSAKYTTTVPGGPDGEYVIVQFSSSFTNKKSAIETVTPMMDKDGTWRVSGYFIK